MLILQVVILSGVEESLPPARLSVAMGFFASLCDGVRRSALIPPRLQISPRRRSLFHALDNLRQVHGVVVQTRKIVREIGVAVPAMLSAVAVFHFSSIRSVCGRLQEILKVIDGVSKKVRIGGANINVELALQLGA